MSLLDDPYIARLFHIESGGNRFAVSPGGRNRGLAQFGPEEERLYGVTDPTDPMSEAQAVARERAAFVPKLQSVLGRPPTAGELYLMHQQGVAGGPALLSADPSMPAWQAVRPFYKSDAVAKSAISGNIPKGSPLYGMDPTKITAGDFRNFWINKFQGGNMPTLLAQSMQRNPVQNGWQQPDRTPITSDKMGPVPPEMGDFYKYTPPPEGQNWAPPAAATPSPTPGPPQGPTMDASNGPDLGGMGGDMMQIAKAFGGGEPSKLQVLPPPQIQYPIPPGLAQARALALAMAMRPMQGTSQTLGTSV